MKITIGVLFVLTTVLLATNANERARENLCYNEQVVKEQEEATDAEIEEAEKADLSDCGSTQARSFAAELQSIQQPSIPQFYKPHCRICPRRFVQIKYIRYKTELCRVLNPVRTVRCNGDRCCPWAQLLNPWNMRTRCLPSYYRGQKVYAVCKKHQRCIIRWMYLPTQCCCRRYRWLDWTKDNRCEDTDNIEAIEATGKADV